MSSYLDSLSGLHMARGSRDGVSFRIGIAVARFNEFITEALLEGALKALQRCGVETENVMVLRVPGAFELPRAAQLLAEATSLDLKDGGDVHAVICLGAVIQGGTPHFEYVCQGTTQGILQVGLDSRKPVIFGVLTCDTVEQALERAGLQEPAEGFSATADHGSENDSVGRNKGAEAALCAIEMLTLTQSVTKDGLHGA